MEEFKDFYNNLSSTIEKDEVFASTLKIEWKMNEGTNAE